MDREAASRTRVTQSLEEASTRSIARIDVLGVGISAIDPDDALAEITHWIAHGDARYVCVTGVHGVMEAQRDP